MGTRRLHSRGSQEGFCSASRAARRSRSFGERPSAMHAMRHPDAHPALLWASLTPPHVCLVLEFAPHGSLIDLLEQGGRAEWQGNVERAPHPRIRYRERPDLPTLPRCMLHLDIKSGNVLLFDGKSRHVASSRTLASHTSRTKRAQEAQLRPGNGRGNDQLEGT